MKRTRSAIRKRFYISKGQLFAVARDNQPPIFVRVENSDDAGKLLVRLHREGARVRLIAGGASAEVSAPLKFWLDGARWAAEPEAK